MNIARKRTHFLFILCCFSSILAKAQPFYFPPDTGVWETINTQNLGWCDDELDDLHGFLEEKNTKAFIILKNGRIAVEWYYGTFTQDSIWYWASAGKSLTSTLIGIAQEEGLLSVDDPTQDYLGVGWTNTTAEQEAQITIRHQLTMTTGLNDAVFSCTNPICLNFVAAAGTRWAYHNGPYTLLGKVIETTSGQSLNNYYSSRVGSKIAAPGAYVSIGFNKVFFSTARSMARFGLLIQAGGVWDTTTVLGDLNYVTTMTSPSQELNPSYGYLWWLNGQSTYMLPATQTIFNGSLINTAPDDLYAALGKDDQKIYIVPSENLVVIRMGDVASEGSLALSDFDEVLWEKIMHLNCTTAVDQEMNNAPQLILSPNPVENQLKVTLDVAIETIFIYNSIGALVVQTKEDTINLSHLSAGVYFMNVKTKDQQMLFQKFVKQ